MSFYASTFVESITFFTGFLKITITKNIRAVIFTTESDNVKMSIDYIQYM